MTPWQARLALIGFLLVAAGINANLLLMQERRTTASITREPPRGVSIPPAPTRPAIRAGASAAKAAASSTTTQPRKRPAAAKARTRSRTPAATASTR